MDSVTFLAVRNRGAEIAGYFLPGILILDVAFGKGLFHALPTTWIEFVLLLVYALALSAPICIAVLVSALPLYPFTSHTEEKKEESVRSGFHEYLLPFSLSATAAIIFVFQYLTHHWHLQRVARAGISVRAVQLLIAYIVTLLILSPVFYGLHRMFVGMLFGFAKKNQTKAQPGAPGQHP